MMSSSSSGGTKGEASDTLSLGILLYFFFFPFAPRRGGSANTHKHKGDKKKRLE